MRSSVVRDQERRPGHRAEKKRRTRERILANAISLFLQSGVRATRSAWIAEASDVSTATLFNYFATKQDLAEAWVRGELVDLLDVAARRHADRALRSGLRSVGRELAESNLKQRNRRLEAWQVVGRAPDAAFVEVPSLTARLASAQADGRLRSDLQASRLTSLLVEAFEGGIVEALIGAPDVAEASNLLRTRVDLVLDGARKRNERVAISALATGELVRRP